MERAAGMGVSAVKTELAGLGGGSERSVDAPAMAGMQTVACGPR